MIIWTGFMRTAKAALPGQRGSPMRRNLRGLPNVTVHYEDITASGQILTG